MRLSVNRESFLKSLTAIAKAIPSRTTNPLLNYIYVSAEEGGRVALIASNSDIGMRIDVEVDTDYFRPGVALFPVRLLAVLSEASGPDVVIKASDDAVTVETSGSSFGNFRLMTSKADDYPEKIKSFAEASFFILDSHTFRRMARQTIFATDPSSNNYAMGGVQVEFGVSGNQQRVRFIATDSHRLAISLGEFTYKAESSIEAPAVPPVVHVKALKLAESQAGDGMVQIAFSENASRIMMKMGATTIEAACVAGRFPDWRRALPKAENIKFNVPLKQMLAAVRQSQLLRDEEGAKAKIFVKKGSLRFSSSVADMGASNVDIPIEFDGEPLKIIFQPSYLVDFVKNVDALNVDWSLVDSESCAVLRTENYSYLVMPCQGD